MIPDWKFADARKPTETERQKLSRLMYVAFCDLRALALDGQTQQVKDLAESQQVFLDVLRAKAKPAQMAAAILNSF